MTNVIDLQAYRKQREERELWSFLTGMRLARLGIFSEETWSEIHQSEAERNGRPDMFQFESIGDFNLAMVDYFLFLFNVYQDELPKEAERIFDEVLDAYNVIADRYPETHGDDEATKGRLEEVVGRRWWERYVVYEPYDMASRPPSVERDSHSETHSQ